MTKALAAMLLASLVVVACGDQTAPVTSPSSSFGASSPSASGSSPGATGSTDPGASSSIGASVPPTAPPSTPTPAPPTAGIPTPTPAPPISEFPQSWSGTWQDPVTGGSGSLELTLAGKGSAFGGSITMDGTACLSNGILDGAYDGRAIAFTVTQRAVEVRFAGEADAATMTGTFTTDCDAMDGSWTATRSSR